LLCKEPLLNEPGVNKNNPDMKSYDQIIEFSNINTAICDIIEKKTSVFMPFFENFYPIVKENFLKNYDKLLEFAEKKNVELNLTATDFKTNFYSMRITVDYNKVIEKLKSSKQIIEIM
jgi:hypothetical protein